MGQGFKVFSSSELSCKWPKVAETMTVAPTSWCKISVHVIFWAQALRSYSRVNSFSVEEYGIRPPLDNFFLSPQLRESHCLKDLHSR